MADNSFPVSSQTLIESVAISLTDNTFPVCGQTLQADSICMADSGFPDYGMTDSACCAMN